MKAALAPIAFAIGILALTVPSHAQSPTGIWLTKDADAHVRIADCGGALCGTIVWLKDPIDDATGASLTDRRNPDPAMRDRPILGIQIMYGMRPSGPGKWSGRFYNSEDGQTYDGNLVVLGPGSAKVEGCVIGICMGEIWQRVQTTAKPARPAGKARNKS